MKRQGKNMCVCVCVCSRMRALATVHMRADTGSAAAWYCAGADAQETRAVCLYVKQRGVRVRVCVEERSRERETADEETGGATHRDWHR